MFFKLFYRGVFLPYFLFQVGMILSLPNYAQKNNLNRISEDEMQTIIYSKNHLSFCLIPNITEKAKINKFSMDRYKMHAVPQFGLEGGFDYHTNFNKNYSLIVGLHGGVAGRNTLYTVPKEDFNPQPKENISSVGKLSRTYDATYLSLPVLLERRWAKARNSFWNASVGLNLRYAVEVYASEGASVIEGGVQQNFFDMNLVFGNERKPWINYNLSAGHSWILTNNNLFKLNLLVNLSFTEFVKGNYQFTLPNKPVEDGSYGLKGSYLGLSASYIFTGANNKLRKLYFKNKYAY